MNSSTSSSPLRLIKGGADPESPRAKFQLSVREHLRMAAADAEVLFGDKVGAFLSQLLEFDPEDPGFIALAELCPAWHDFEKLFDYAVLGHLSAEGPPISGEFYDGIVAGTVVWPKEIQKIFMLGVARQVLDGGPREWNPESAPPACLSVNEVALLANMEEASVRNALSSRQLVGELINNRVYVSTSEARRWLARRRGFVPTKGDGTPQEPIPIRIPAEKYELLAAMAAAEAVSVEEILCRLIEGTSSAVQGS